MNAVELKRGNPMDMSLILLLLILGGAGFLVVLYNRLVALRQNRNNAFSDIDVQLKQRFNLVPQLVETVKGYASHENEVFTKVTEARAGVEKAGDGASEGRIKAEGLLGGALMGLLAVAEDYPDLKADANFRRLMDELSDIENKIAAARRFFNNTTAEYNTAIQQFPAVLIANMFNFNEEKFFELGEDEADQVREAPDVSFGS